MREVCSKNNTHHFLSIKPQFHTNLSLTTYARGRACTINISPDIRLASKILWDPKHQSYTHIHARSHYISISHQSERLPSLGLLEDRDRAMQEDKGGLMDRRTMQVGETYGVIWLLLFFCIIELFHILPFLLLIPGWSRQFAHHWKLEITGNLKIIISRPRTSLSHSY